MEEFKKGFDSIAKTCLQTSSKWKPLNQVTATSSTKPNSTPTTLKQIGEKSMNITITPRGPEKMRVMKITKQNDGSITCRLCFENFKNIHEVTRHAPHCRSLNLINQVDFDKSEEHKSEEPDNYYRTPGHCGTFIIRLRYLGLEHLIKIRKKHSNCPIQGRGYPISFA